MVTSELDRIIAGCWREHLSCDLESGIVRYYEYSRNLMSEYKSSDHKPSRDEWQVVLAKLNSPLHSRWWSTL